MNIKKFLPFLSTLSVNLSTNSIVQSHNSLPEIGNIYSKQLYLPLIGNQEIEIEYFNINKAYIRLNGVININGTSKVTYNEKTQKFNFDLSDELKIIMKNFKCKIENPHYDIVNDSIYFKLYIALLLNKNLILKRKYIES